MPNRIFIAEDDESISVLLAFLMRKLGHETRIVRSGAEAMEAIEAFKPDLALLDLMLPARSGLEICHAIRAHPALRETRVLMLTAKGSVNDVARALAAGADEYVVKPFSTQELAERVQALLDERGGGYGP
jgi:two-component system, OmpR family, alkaline phosphatase synthesis response regulator PhoP